MSSFALEDRYLEGKDNRRIVESARRENRLGECLCFLKNGRSAKDWFAYLKAQKVLEKSLMRRKRWCDPI